MAPARWPVLRRDHLRRVGEIAQDFLNYIMSAGGQAVINEATSPSTTPPRPATAAGVSGEITVGGSSSVTPVSGRSWPRAYMALNPDVTVVVQQSGSTTGVTGTSKAPSIWGHGLPRPQG